VGKGENPGDGVAEKNAESGYIYRARDRESLKFRHAVGNWSWKLHRKKLMLPIFIFQNFIIYLLIFI